MYDKCHDWDWYGWIVIYYAMIGMIGKSYKCMLNAMIGQYYMLHAMIGMI